MGYSSNRHLEQAMEQLAHRSGVYSFCSSKLTPGATPASRYHQHTSLIQITEKEVIDSCSQTKVNMRDVGYMANMCFG
eukprot:5523861-Amphidinium_carterae.1